MQASFEVPVTKCSSALYFNGWKSAVKKAWYYDWDLQ